MPDTETPSLKTQILDRAGWIARRLADAHCSIGRTAPKMVRVGNVELIAPPL